MKKILIFWGILLFTKVAIANEIIFANKSAMNPIEVIYRFCTSNLYEENKRQYSCGPNNLIIVNPNTQMVTTPPPDSVAISVVSAAEKNSLGAIVVETKYQYGDFHSHCGYPLDMSQAKRNSAFIILDDLNSTHAIVCDAKGYLSI